MDDEEYNCTMRPAFYVEGPLLAEFDPTVPPSNAQEYLRRVMTEAAKCDEVVSAEIDPSKIRPQKTLEVLPGLEEAAKVLIPSQDWQSRQVSDFSVVRKIIQKAKADPNTKEVRIPGRNDIKGWRTVCIGDTVGNPGNFQVSDPLLSILVNPRMTQNTLIQVLEYNVEWLAEGFTVQKGKWIYAILACLEKPLYPETCSLLRDLARKCAHIRANLETPDHEFLVHLNLLICLVANYYRQLDLAD